MTFDPDKTTLGFAADPSTCDHVFFFRDGMGATRFSDFIEHVDLNKGRWDSQIMFFEVCPECGQDLRKFVFYAVPHHKTCRPKPPETLCTCWKQEFRDQMSEETGYNLRQGAELFAKGIQSVRNKLRLKTGFPALDARLSEGMKPGEMTALVAISRSGHSRLHEESFKAILPHTSRRYFHGLIFFGNTDAEVQLQHLKDRFVQATSVAGGIQQPPSTMQERADAEQEIKDALQDIAAALLGRRIYIGEKLVYPPVPPNLTKIEGDVIPKPQIDIGSVYFFMNTRHNYLTGDFGFVAHDLDEAKLYADNFAKRHNAQVRDNCNYVIEFASEPFRVLKLDYGVEVTRSDDDDDSDS